MTETTIGVRELKTRLSAYLRRVKAGQAMTITERGKPVGRIVPVRSEVGTGERVRQLTRTGIVAWSGQKLGRKRPASPRVRGKRMLADVVLENRE